MKLFFRQVLSSTQVHAQASKLLLGIRNSSHRNTRLYAKFRVVWILLREIETGKRLEKLYFTDSVEGDQNLSSTIGYPYTNYT